MRAHYSRLSPRLQRLYNLVAALRVLGRMDADDREALRYATHWLGIENIRARQSPSIHRDALISPLATLRFTERVEIERRANLAAYCHVWGGFSTAWARVASEVHIGTGAVLVAGNHDWSQPGSIYDVGMAERDVVIEHGATISANAVIVGCTVGRYAVVGANSVVTKDVEPNTIVAGVPARVVGERPAPEEQPGPRVLI